MVFYFLGSILSLTLWLYLTFCHGKRKILKNLNFWSNSIVFENVKFNSKIFQACICNINHARSCSNSLTHFKTCELDI